MRPLAVLFTSLLLSCRSGPAPSDATLPTIPVTLPNGVVVRAELATDPSDQQRGLMFRTSLAADRGMLFVFSKPGSHPFWMFQTLIPLDIIWMDAIHRIVFLSPNTPPCPSPTPQQCPNYGGEPPAQFVLELAAGSIASHRLQLGDTLRF